MSYNDGVIVFFSELQKPCLECIPGLAWIRSSKGTHRRERGIEHQGNLGLEFLPEKVPNKQREIVCAQAEMKAQPRQKLEVNKHSQLILILQLLCVFQGGSSNGLLPPLSVYFILSVSSLSRNSSHLYGIPIKVK